MTDHHGHDHNSADLTKNQRLVLEAVQAADGPKSAYDLLDALRPQGFKAPLQVYRALDRLVAEGFVHRIESLSAFVACQHPDCQSHAAVVFMICAKCGHVAERSDTGIGKDLLRVAENEGFRSQHASIELRGLCQKC